MFGEKVMTISSVTLPFLRETDDWVEEAIDLMVGCRGSDLVRRPQVLVTPCRRYCQLGPAEVSGRCLVLTPGCVEDRRCKEKSSKSNNTITVNNNKETENYCNVSDNNTSATDSSCINGTLAANNKMAAATKREERPWHLNVDLKGCDEVRATTKSDIITVEGRGQNGDSQVMVRHITTLPPHVNPNTLMAIFRNGQLTINQRPTSPVKIIPVATSSDNKQIEEDTHHHSPPSPQHHDPTIPQVTHPSSTTAPGPN